MRPKSSSSSQKHHRPRVRVVHVSIHSCVGARSGTKFCLSQVGMGYQRITRWRIATSPNLTDHLSLAVKPLVSRPSTPHSPTLPVGVAPCSPMPQRSAHVVWGEGEGVSCQLASAHFQSAQLAAQVSCSLLLLDWPACRPLLIPQG